MNQNRIGLLIAIKWEIPNFFINFNLDFKREFNTVKLKYDSEIIVGISGPGKKNAIDKTELLLKKYDIDFLINIGFSGTIKNNARIGDIIVAKNLLYNEEKIQVDNNLIKKVITPLKSDNRQYKLGDVQTFDSFVHSKEILSSEVLAVDMESYHIAKTAKKFGVKTIVIRSITDYLSEKDPKFFHSYYAFFKTYIGKNRACKCLDNICGSIFNL